MPLDGFTLGALARELDSALEGGRVDRVQQPEKDEIVLTIRAKGDNHRLLLSANPNHTRVHLTKSAVVSPNTPPMLCMLMRKHLGGARLLSIAQQGADRVLILRFEALNDMGDPCEKQLILEVMGRHSNLILVGETGRVIDCARHVSAEQSRVRELLPGLRYEPAPEQDKLDPSTLTKQALIDALSPLVGQRLDKALVTNLSGVSPQLAKELTFRICGEEQGELTIALLPAACDKLLAFFSHRETVPTLLVDEYGTPLDFSAFPYLSREQSRQKTMPSMSAALEAFFTLRDRTERLREKSYALRHFLQNALERCEKKRAIQLQTLKDAEGKETLRIKADLIASQIHLIPRGASEAEVTDYFSETMAKVRIPLEPSLSPAENAQRYYKQYNKLKSAAKLVVKQKRKNDEDIAYLEGQLDDLDKCTTVEELTEIRMELEREGYLRAKATGKKQKMPISKPMAFRSTAGIPIYVGKNNIQNDRLTFSAGQDELWFHVKDRPGSHTILRSTAPDEHSILEAAMLAAYYSSAKNSENVAVDYAQRKYVKKPSGAKPGFVIYTHQTTLFITPEESLTRRLAAPEE